MDIFFVFLFSEGTRYLSRDNFTLEEREQLIRVLESNFNLKATIKIKLNSRARGFACFRIRFKSLSLNRLKELRVPDFIPEMLSKLNISKEKL